MTLRDIFTRLGLPKHADEIYALLEKKGPLSVSAIARDTQAHRPAVYRALLALEKGHIVTEKSFGKRTFYVAESRARIDIAFKQAADGVAAATRNERYSDTRRSMGAARFLEGKHSIAALFNDVVEHSKRGDTFYRYTSERDLDQVNALLPPDYRKRRDAKHLERLVISNPESGKRKRARLERFVKHIGSEKESFHQNAIQLIYGDRIGFVDLNTHQAFIIENKTLAEFQKTIFRALYRRL